MRLIVNFAVHRINSNQKNMDRVIIIFAVIGTLMFAAYIYFIIKTSYDDEKQKKKEKAEQNGSSNGTE